MVAYGLAADNNLVKGQDATALCKMYDEARQLREPYEPDWRMAVAHCRPRQYNVWLSGSNPSLQGNARAAKRYSFDSTAANALPKFSSILMRLNTPVNMQYQKIKASDAALMHDLTVRSYFEEMTLRLFKFRYAYRARFIQSKSEQYNSLGIYGVGPMFIGKRKANMLDKKRGAIYKACRMYDIYFLLDDEGEIYAVFRRVWWNARQFKTKFPGVTAPPCVAKELEKTDPSETEYFEFFHCVKRRDDYDPKKIGKNKPWVGTYTAYTDKMTVGDEEGYLTCPYIIPRIDTDSDEAYSYSPALQALPSMGSLNAMKKSALKQGQKAVDPPLLAFDDGALSGSQDVRPGKIIHGGLNAQGNELVKIMRGGDFRISEKLIEDERKDVRDSFLVTLFELLVESPEMTATQVIERMSEKASLMAPTMGRLQAEDMGPGTERELALMEELGYFNDLPLPPALEEAGGEYEIEYTSPLARGMYAEETSGFLRTFETAVQAATATNDPSLLYPFNMKVALPEMAERQSAPARWMNDIKKQNKMADDAKAAQQQQTMIENAGSLAGAAKVATDMQKTGGV
jgi:hypothetical protein